MEMYPHRSSDDALIAAAAKQARGHRDGSHKSPLAPRFADRFGESLGNNFGNAALPGYEFVGPRFRGGQGEVYEAIHTSTRRRVAIKFLYEFSNANNRTRHARFTREVEILAQLRHPNVVAIHDSAVYQGHYYYVMDFVEGVPIDRWLHNVDESSQSAKAQRQRRVLTLFCQICDGVQAAHIRGVIHRDLKPANILVDAAGAPRIVDFGLAKTLQADGGDMLTAMTETGQFVGSLPWSSPEQVGGDPALLDTRSDVYSLGVMLYAAVVGQHPFALQGGVQEIIHRIQIEPPTPPGDYHSDIDDDLETILLKCLSKEPGRRYQTAGELGRDIERYLENEPIEAKRDSTAYLLRKMVARYRWPLAAIASFLLMLTVATVVSVSLWRQAVVARDQAVASQQNADARFDEVRALAHTFVFDLDDQIRDLPGSTTARLWATETALNYLDQLAADSRADASLRKELGQGYRRVGQILGQPGHANLGKFDDAYTSLTKGRDILRALTETNREDLGVWRELAAVEMSLGDVQRVRKQLDQAQYHYGQYRLVAEEMAQYSGEPRDRREVAIALLCLSDLAVAQQRYDDAQANAATASDILYALPEDGDYPQDLQRDRSVAMTRYGDCLVLLKDTVGAEKVYRQSLALDEARLENAADSTTARRDVSVGYLRMADMLASRGNYEEAMPMLAKALTLREAAWADDPVNAQAERDLSTAYYSAGALYSNRSEIMERPIADRQEDLRTAKMYLQKALERWTAMRDRGVMQKRDEGAGDELRGAIATVEQALAGL